MAPGGALLLFVAACVVTMVIAFLLWLGSRLGWWEWPVNSV
jgi:uncharacterized paraquat-inducible protein A